MSFKSPSNANNFLEPESITLNNEQNKGLNNNSNNNINNNNEKQQNMKSESETLVLNKFSLYETKTVLYNIIYIYI